MTPAVTSLLRISLRECASYNDRCMNYRFHQGSMRKLEALGFAKRREGDTRIHCCWHITAAGRQWLADSASPEQP